jgi:hypothetical protein
MSNLPKEADPSAWHRYFAIECNNRAWALAVQARTKAQDGEMLDAAHGAAFHWGQVGTELNVARARMLLAEVHALLGHGVTALSYASQVREFFLGRPTDDWELAFTHAIHAHAAHVAGDSSMHRASYREAEVALAAIADPGDRAIVQETFDLIPRPEP